jgi:hypothetical protein
MEDQLNHDMFREPAILKGASRTGMKEEQNQNRKYGVPFIGILFCLFLAGTGCTLTDFDIENRHWDEELAELQQAAPVAEDCVVICLSQVYRNRPGYFTEDEYFAKQVMKDAPFALSEEDPTQATYFAMIRAYEQGDMNATFLLTMVTLGLYPYCSKRTLNLEITLVDPKGTAIKMYERQAEYDIWAGLVFLLWPPGWTPPRLVKKWIYQDLARDVIREMYEEDTALFTDAGQE